MMRRGIWSLSVALAILLYSAAGAWALKTSPSELLAHADGFDGKLVTLSGTVSKLDPRVSRKGNSYYTFELYDGRRAITVFSFGEPRCRNGVQANVEGRFQKVKRVGRYTFHNQVDATSVVCP
jgi:hypothetical protein